MERAELPVWPTYGYADDAREALSRALAHGPVALATIIEVGGGGPRPVGTQMVFGQGVVSGFLSGGCIEGDVARHAADCLTDGAPRRLVYGQGSPWPDIRLMCGARLTVMVERILPEDEAVAALFTAARERRPAVWVSDGERRACQALATAKAWDGAFARTFEPPWRLVVLGSDPTALAIASLGVESGYETTLVRAKGPLEPPPIARLAYSRLAPREALAQIGPDVWTAIAICHHDLELDEAALSEALASRAGYVGLLGGRARLAERLERLRRAGFTERDLKRLSAPIGMDLGGKAPFEIAIAVLAEVTSLRHFTEEPRV